MKKNMGLIDRIIRVLIAVVVVVLYLTSVVSGAFGIVLLVLSGIFTLTSLISYCPLYLPFGLSTKKNK